LEGNGGYEACLKAFEHQGAGPPPGRRRFGFSGPTAKPGPEPIHGELLRGSGFGWLVGIRFAGPQRKIRCLAALHTSARREGRLGTAGGIGPHRLAGGRWQRYGPPNGCPLRRANLDPGV